MSRARYLEHIREGLPWATGVALAGTYLTDHFHNQGRAFAAVQDWASNFSLWATRKSSNMVSPVLDMLDRFEGDALLHTDDERFLNLPMQDQIQRLVGWFRKGDLPKAFHYLAVFTKDRSSPATDFPVNELTFSPDLLHEIVTARGSNKMTAGLFMASLSALAVEPRNARELVHTRGVCTLIRKALEEAKGSEVETTLGLKCLSLMALHQDQRGTVERLLVKEKCIPVLLSLLIDRPDSVYGVRFPTQLLSCVIRADPSTIADEMTGRYQLSSEDKVVPLNIYNIVKEGLQAAKGPTLEYYLRLCRDCIAADYSAAMKGFHDASLMGVVLGVLLNHSRYIEILPTLSTILKMLVRTSDRPSDLLAYQDSVLILTQLVEMSGRHNHDVIRDFQESLEMAVLDPRANADLLEKKKPVLHRFRSSCRMQLSGPELPHVRKDWLNIDAERLKKYSLS